ncbi:hypothetical protein [Paraburkholderia tropica]|uniref:hypothetical protein n=1 Tax=Paraburkholderia tropica TaxID=92647 RepID=UPI0007EC7572|nr:hypothetical protein [Paraburkholderia tropica]OBR48046.1 hypothetical protein A6456_36240 [Paraburkholderia tropica]
MNTRPDRTSRFQELADSYLEHIRILVQVGDCAANVRDFIGPWWTFQRAAAAPGNDILIHTNRDVGIWLNNPCPHHAKPQLQLQDWISEGAWQAMERKACKTTWAASPDKMPTKPRSQWSDHYKMDRLIIDHAVPIKVIRDMLFARERKAEYSCKENLKGFLEGYVKHGVLTEKENALLDCKSLNSSMPASWNGVDPYARYSDVAIKQSVIE